MTPADALADALLSGQSADRDKGEDHNKDASNGGQGNADSRNNAGPPLTPAARLAATLLTLMDAGGPRLPYARSNGRRGRRKAYRCRQGHAKADKCADRFQQRVLQ